MISLRLGLGIATVLVAAFPGASLGQEHHSEAWTAEEAFQVYTDFIEGKEPTLVWGLAFGVGF